MRGRLHAAPQQEAHTYKCTRVPESTNADLVFPLYFNRVLVLFTGLPQALPFSASLAPPVRAPLLPRDYCSAASSRLPGLCPSRRPAVPLQEVVTGLKRKPVSVGLHGHADVRPFVGNAQLYLRAHAYALKPFNLVFCLAGV